MIRRAWLRQQAIVVLLALGVPHKTAALAAQIQAGKAN
jgi:hypothetical protein